VRKAKGDKSLGITGNGAVASFGRVGHTHVHEFHELHWLVSGNNNRIRILLSIGSVEGTVERVIVQRRDGVIAVEALTWV
jgi:hypothetical protein